jgi:prepilin-type N-terminal cleavage/methylation domain-containing protein
VNDQDAMDGKMKHERGFTLVELMVVVSITVLLLAWGIPSYSTWKKKHDIENQMVQLYSDLQLGRMTAYGDKSVSGVLWGGGASFTSYQIMYDKNNNGTIDNGAAQVPGTGAVTVKSDVGAIAVATSPATPGQLSVSFDSRGFLYTANAPDTATQITFYVAPSSGAAMDCVTVRSTRISLGKWNGAGCAPK